MPDGDTTTVPFTVPVGVPDGGAAESHTSGAAEAKAGSACGPVVTSALPSCPAVTVMPGGGRGQLHRGRQRLAGSRGRGVDDDDFLTTAGLPVARARAAASATGAGSGAADRAAAASAVARGAALAAGAADSAGTRTMASATGRARPADRRRRAP